MRTVTLHVPLNRKSIPHNLECLDSVLCCFALKKKKKKKKKEGTRKNWAGNECHIRNLVVALPAEASTSGIFDT